MICFKKDWEAPRQGFNVYPLSNQHSAGFVLRIWNFAWRIRYSKSTKQWFNNFHKIDPNAMKKLKMWESLHGIKYD
jgi:hypothetical protein